jgi:predicted TIM-barrel fold metal-dependent hydrolase
VNPFSAPLRVDAHVHLSRYWPEIRRTGYAPDLDYSARGLLGEMDALGLDYALAIQLFQAPEESAAMDEGRSTFVESGRRLFPVGTVDPTKGADHVQAVLRRMNDESDLVAVKLFPGYRSFYPHDARLDPVYEFAARRRLPVLLHQGDTLDGLGLIKFARPVELDEVAGRFRDVRFVLCHLGNPWIDEAAEIVYKNPNVYADLSGLLGPPSSPYFARGLEQARRRVQGAIVSTGLPERFLFGSDWPLESLASAVDLVRGLELTEPERVAIMGENARALFRLPPRRP